MKFLLIFSPVFFGLLAGLLYLMGIDTDQVAREGWQAIKGAALFAGFLTLAFGVAVAPRIYSRSQSFERAAPAGYQAPEILSAKVSTATLRTHEGPIQIGELEVTASHSSHVSRRMRFIPSGAIIQTLRRGSLYRVRFPIYPAASYPIEGSLPINSDRIFVEEVARANGFRGRVQ